MVERRFRRRYGAVRDQAKTVRSWPLLVLAVPAAAEVWSGLVALRLVTAGKPVSRRALRSGGVKGSNQSLNTLAASSMPNSPTSRPPSPKS